MLYLVSQIYSRISTFHINILTSVVCVLNLLLNMPKTALIVVDMQNDFLTGTLALKDCPAKQNGEEVVEVINSLTSLPGWDLIVFTLDWHPDDHISFVTNAHKYQQHDHSKKVFSPGLIKSFQPIGEPVFLKTFPWDSSAYDGVCSSKTSHVVFSVFPQIETKHAEVYDIVSFSVEDNCKMDQIMWPPHCIQGSWGAKLHQDLKIPEGSVQVKKGSKMTLDSYSAFFDNDRRNETELRQLLQSHGIEQTFICGVATDICVKYTVFDSLDLGFQTYVIEDACRGVHHENIKLTKDKMVKEGVHCITSVQVSSLLAQSGQADQEENTNL